MKHTINLKLMAPIGAILVALCVSLVLYPVIKGEAKEIPLALVSLDQGMSTPQGQVVLGPKVLEGIQTKMTGMLEDIDPAPLELVSVEDQQSLDQGFEDGDFYGAIVMPEDFTKMQMTNQQTNVQLILNQGASMQVATMLEKQIKEMAAQASVELEVVYIHPVGEDMGSGNGSLYAFVLTWIATFVSSLMLYMGYRREGTPGFRPLGEQLGIGVVISLLVGLTVSLILKGIFDFAIPFGETFLLLALGSFCLLAMIVAVLNWLGKPGIGLLVLMLLFGLLTPNLPYEFLPGFWQNWIYPWIPMRFLGDAIRELFYLDGGVWSHATKVLIGIGGGGMIVSLLSAMKPIPGGDRSVKDLPIS